MALRNRTTFGIEVDRPEPERMSADDMATRTGEALREDALAAQLRLGQRMPSAQPGTCSNCGHACLVLAVYCDELCRDDHEKRLTAQRRTGARVLGARAL